MADSRALLPRQQLLALVVELRKVDRAEPVDPETQPLEVVDGIEAFEREHTSGSVLGG